MTDEAALEDKELR